MTPDSKRTVVWRVDGDEIPHARRVIVKEGAAVRRVVLNLCGSQVGGRCGTLRRPRVRTADCGLLHEAKGLAG